MVYWLDIFDLYIIFIQKVRSQYRVDSYNYTLDIGYLEIEDGNDCENVRYEHNQ